MTAFKSMIRALIVQNRNFHHECIGMAIEYLMQYKPDDIYLLIPEDLTYGQEWGEFFVENYKGVVSVSIIRQIEGMYDHVFYLTASDYHECHFTYSHKAYGIAHVTEGIIDVPGFTNFCLSPLVKGAVELLPYNFKVYATQYVPDYYPGFTYFMNNDYWLHQMGELSSVFAKVGKKLLYVKRSDSYYSHPNVISATNVPVKHIISLYLHKKLMAYPAIDSWHLKDRMSGSYHLSASFGTPTLMWQPLYDIYKDIIEANNFPVVSFANTYELEKLLLAS